MNAKLQRGEFIISEKHAKQLGKSAIERLEIALASREFSSDVRKKYAESGIAMPDGSFPIPDKGALRRAIQAFGRAPESKRAAVKAHIKRRARALGATDMLPKDW